jgi:hypothetical protein
VGEAARHKLPVLLCLCPMHLPHKTVCAKNAAEYKNSRLQGNAAEIFGKNVRITVCGQRFFVFIVYSVLRVPSIGIHIRSHG